MLSGGVLVYLCRMVVVEWWWGGGRMVVEWWWGGGNGSVPMSLMEVVWEPLM